MRLVPSACLSALLALAGQTSTLGQNRWIELDFSEMTVTYDLTTVQMLDPGRFTIRSNTQDHPDVIRLRLAALTTLKSYCGRPDGEYAPPSELFTLGPPDMPVEHIKVETQPGHTPFKNVVWGLPYLRLAVNLKNGPEEDMAFFDCKGPAVESPDKEYDEFRSIIMNGSASKVLYDCRHGIMGFFLNPDDPPSKAITIPGIGGAYLSAYLRLCPAIVGGMPYMPNSTQNR
jgi:hypothetical protein